MARVAARALAFRKMDEIRLQRVAENERVLHEANERIERFAAEAAAQGWPGQSLDATFFCACGRRDCRATVTLSLGEYDAVHRQPHRYVVAKGHLNPEIERLVEQFDAYDVVEKLPQYR